MSVAPGAVIVIDGASSAGKSTLVRAAQPVLPRPFVAHGLDLFLFSDFLPRAVDGSVRDWPALRPAVLDGFCRSLRGFADAGIDVLCDVVIESAHQAEQLERSLAGLDVLWVALRASAVSVRERERARGDRTTGEAERDLATVHTFRSYDLELDSEAGPAACAERLVQAWTHREGGPPPVG